MNPWVVHRNKDVFGHDAHLWNPDRWLGDMGQRILMEKSLLTVSPPIRYEPRMLLILANSSGLVIEPASGKISATWKYTS